MRGFSPQKKAAPWANTQHNAAGSRAPGVLMPPSQHSGPSVSNTKDKEKPAHSRSHSAHEERKGEGEAAAQRFCWRAAPKGAVFLGTPQGRVHARRRAPSAACTSPSAAAQSTRRGSRRARQIEGGKLYNSNTTGEHTAFLLTILRDTERRQKPYLGRARHRRLALSPAPLHSVSPRPNPST